MARTPLSRRPGSPAALKVKSPAVQEDLLKRLRRIEGQVRGVQKMIAEERECRDILQQLAAVRSAVHHTTLVLVRSYASECLLKPDADSTPEEVVDSLMGILDKVP